jgi:hypothetical protein
MKDILDTFFIKQVNTTKVSVDLEQHIYKLGEELMKKLTDEETEIFIDYADAQNEFLRHCSTENFKQGFWVGCRFMREVGE